mmetsp:Transcript_26535/g.57231  ORF Transcript_26535/g.57231 Transcript_26535/m.57231 type:complete len:202 (+) Transcript_26535:36-641(+)
MFSPVSQASDSPLPNGGVLTQSPSPSKGSFHSHSPMPRVISAEGTTIDEADEDVQIGQGLSALLDQAYSHSMQHIVSMKKRLIEEKEIALAQAERAHIARADSAQIEIRNLQHEVGLLEARSSSTEECYAKLTHRTTGVMSRHHARYSAEYSLRRLFTAWSSQILSTRNNNKLDRLASLFTGTHQPIHMTVSLCYPIPIYP